jgi:hypothetical protein
MRKIIVLLVVYCLLVSPVLAVDATKSAASSPSATQKAPISEKAKDLVDKINNKIDKMGLNLKRAYSGKIRSLGNSTITLTYDSGEISVETNEATNFFKIRSGNRTSTDFKNLKVGADLTVVGLLDEGSHTLVARTVLDKIRRVAVNGKVSSLKGNKITVNFPEGKTQVIDTSTASIKKLSSKKEITASKVSEISEDDFLYAIGYFEDDSETLSALKLFLIPQSILKSPSPSPTPTPKPNPSPKVKIPSI